MIQDVLIRTDIGSNNYSSKDDRTLHCDDFPSYSDKSLTSRDANLAKRFAVFLGLKKRILGEKTVFSPVVQYTWVVINIEKKQYFPKSCSIFEVFSSKNSTKYCKKVTFGISALGIIELGGGGGWV